MTGRPPARFAETISASLAVDERAPSVDRSGSSLAPSTTKEPSSPWARPTRPIVTRSSGTGERRARARTTDARVLALSVPGAEHGRTIRRSRAEPALARAGRAGADDGRSAGQPALPADHLANVVGRDVEANDAIAVRVTVSTRTASGSSTTRRARYSARFQRTSMSFAFSKRATDWVG